MEYVLTGATLIDGNGGAPLANSAVFVQGERIAWAGSAADLPAEAQGAKLSGLSHSKRAYMTPPKIASGQASSPADLYHRRN